MEFEGLIGHSRIRYFSYARYAMCEALRICSVSRKDRVLLPAFICRDLLSSIHAVSATPIYYSVNEALCLSEPSETLPDAKAVIAVNYFGFPQDLKPFRDYCDRTGAILIEDNAHGLFSRDERGELLGTRGDIGIFSLRKTIPVPNGAALVVNKEDVCCRLAPQIEFNLATEPVSLITRRTLMKLSPFIGSFPSRIFTALARRVRKLIDGHEILPSPVDAEYVLPENPNPCSHLPEYLAVVDIDKEKERRRSRHLEIDKILMNTLCHPVFQSFPDNIVPYGYPFYCLESRIPEIKKLLGKQGLECFCWPELPDAIRPTAPDRYRSVWLVNFLW